MSGFEIGEWVAIQNSVGSWEVEFESGSFIGDQYLCIGIVASKGDLEDCCSGESARKVASLVSKAPKMYEMLESAGREIYMLINEVNKLRMTQVNSQTETPPDLHDMETCYLIGSLLAEARGE